MSITEIYKALQSKLSMENPNAVNGWRHMRTQHSLSLKIADLSQFWHIQR